MTAPPWHIAMSLRGGVHPIVEALVDVVEALFGLFRLTVDPLADLVDPVVDPLRLAVHPHDARQDRGDPASGEGEEPAAGW